MTRSRKVVPDLSKGKVCRSMGQEERTDRRTLCRISPVLLICEKTEKIHAILADKLPD